MPVACSLIITCSPVPKGTQLWSLPPMMERPSGPPDLLRATCSTTAVLVTLLTVVSVKVVLVMDSVTRPGLAAVTAEGWVTLTLNFDLKFSKLNNLLQLCIQQVVPYSIRNHGVEGLVV